MTKEEALMLLRGGPEGVREWNRRRTGGEKIPSLEGAVLVGANLGGVNLLGTSLSSANLFEADLSGADLSEANLRSANVSRVNLRGANLFRTNLSGANLFSADFTNSRFGYTTVACDLSRGIGLDEAKHVGPSKVSLDALLSFEEDLPEKFLRGCGLADEEIDYFRSRIGSPIRYYSCFISYTESDREIADRIHSELQVNNVRCWFAPQDMKIGEAIRSTINEAIRVRDKLVLIMSEESIASGWVKKEVKLALAEEEKREKTVLFPIRLDDAVFDCTDRWANDIQRERHIGDFTDWKDHDSYKAAFERLLRDLKKESEGSDD